MTDAQLQALVAVADLGSFTEAARRLGTSQSAVSHALAALEEALRVTLVQRNAHGVRLTDIGQRTARDARQVIELKAKIRQDADASRRLRIGTLRVGSFGVTASRRLLPPIIERFAERYPGIEVLVNEGSDDEVEQWLRDGSVDVASVTLPNDEFDVVPLAEDLVQVVLPASHPLAAEREVDARRLSEFPFIFGSGGCELLLRRAAQGATLDIRHRIRESDTILSMVARGAGISLMPALALPDPLPDGVVTRPVHPFTPRRVALAVRKRDIAPLPCRAFLEVARAVAARRNGVGAVPAPRVRRAR
jgi:DNA-binding transcriptional LysR family regulator